MMKRKEYTPRSLEILSMDVLITQVVLLKVGLVLESTMYSYKYW